MTTDTKNRLKSIEKIKLMLEVTEENGSFPAEIASASSRIQSLMDKYSIEWFEVDKDLEEDNFISVDADVVICRTAAWHWRLARVIARITHTKHFRGNRYSKDDVEKSADSYNPDYAKIKNKKKANLYKTFWFYGEGNSAKLAAELFQKWLARIDIASLVEAKKAKIEDKSINSRVYRNSFLDGCIYAMNKKVDESEEERNKEMSSALVVVDDKVESFYTDFSRSFGKIAIGGNRLYSSEGHKSGSSYGSSINPLAKEIE